MGDNSRHSDSERLFEPWAEFLSLSLEIKTLENRVRKLLATAKHPQGRHNLSDGNWKESILRSVLKRRLPKHIEPVTGFVVSKEDVTGQIDILLIDNTKPVLLRDGDFVIALPNAVKGIIEVKTRIDSVQTLGEYLHKLANDAKTVRDGMKNDDHETKENIFVGLFSYDIVGQFWDRWREDVLGELERVACHEYAHDKEEKNSKKRVALSLDERKANRQTSYSCEERVVNHVALGESVFARFFTEFSDRKCPYRNDVDSWRLYWLKKRAFGYFVGNVLDSVAPKTVGENLGLFFSPPDDELEANANSSHCIGQWTMGEQKPCNLIGSNSPYANRSVPDDIGTFKDFISKVKSNSVDDAMAKWWNLCREETSK